uniref:Putative secreted protein n=1 Tax=Anopheles darlingi TaxID=43151 RepID=A0A2M4DDP9_ANODA
MSWARMWPVCTALWALPVASWRRCPSIRSDWGLAEAEHASPTTASRVAESRTAIHRLPPGQARRDDALWLLCGDCYAAERPTVRMEDVRGPTNAPIVMVAAVTLRLPAGSVAELVRSIRTDRSSNSRRSRTVAGMVGARCESSAAVASRSAC